MSRCTLKSLCPLLLLSLVTAVPGKAAPVAAGGVAGALPAITPWCQAYTPAARPLHRALDEALDSVGTGWGPDSRGLGYPLHQALLPVASLLPLPDPLLDRRLRQALLSLEGGAEACMKSMPMTTRLRLVEGARALAELETKLAALSPACLPGSRSGGAALTVVVGVEGEGLALSDTPLGSQPAQGAAANAPTARSAEKAPAKPKRASHPKPAPAQRPKPHRSGAL
jgi:hypothetical protein